MQDACTCLSNLMVEVRRKGDGILQYHKSSLTSGNIRFQLLITLGYEYPDITEEKHCIYLAWKWKVLYRNMTIF